MCRPKHGRMQLHAVRLRVSVHLNYQPITQRCQLLAYIGSPISLIYAAFISTMIWHRAVKGVIEHKVLVSATAKANLAKVLLLPCIIALMVWSASTKVNVQT